MWRRGRDCCGNRNRSFTTSCIELLRKEMFYGNYSTFDRKYGSIGQFPTKTALVHCKSLQLVAIALKIKNLDINLSLQHLWPFTFQMRIMTFLEYTRNRFYQSDSKCIACSIKCLRPIMSYNKSKSRRIFIFDKTNYKRIYRFCLINMWAYCFCCFGCNRTNHRAQNFWPKLKSKPHYRNGYSRQGTLDGP